MKTTLAVGFALLALVLLTLVGSCSKEKTVTSTEYVHDIKYVDSPPDTIMVYDTTFRTDTVRVNTRDTLHVTDTVRINTVVHDTIRVTNIVHDTVYTVRNYYDTVVVTDTVIKMSYVPTAASAVFAMQIQTDPLVLQFVQQQVGQSDGWIFYLTPEQMYIQQVSTGVYDIGAYVDYYAADFSGDYPLEVAWRMTYKSGDPTNPNNWTMADPPSGLPGFARGITLSPKATPGRLTPHATKN